MARCQFVKDTGEPCRAPALLDEEFCWFHSPNHTEEVAEARRVGGQKRRHQKAVVEIFDFHGLGTVPDIQQLLSSVCIDTLALDNSVPRTRALTYIIQTALKCLEVGDLEQRVAAMEAATTNRALSPASDFDIDLDLEEDAELKELTP
jgi:hypothetical protein